MLKLFFAQLIFPVVVAFIPATNHLPSVLTPLRFPLQSKTDGNEVDDLFSSIAGMGVPTIRANAKAFAGDYDEKAAKSKMESLIADEPVLVFSSTTCPYCTMAKEILDSKKAKYTTIEYNEVEDGQGLRAEMGEIVGRSSVPAIFIGGEYIGGCNDGGKGGIVPLENSGELDELLKKVGAI